MRNSFLKMALLNNNSSSCMNLTNTNNLFKIWFNLEMGILPTVEVAYHYLNGILHAGCD